MCALRTLLINFNYMHIHMYNALLDALIIFSYVRMYVYFGFYNILQAHIANYSYIAIYIH